MSEEDFANPPATDFHGRKRELLRKGVEKGKLSWDEIRKGLGSSFASEAELEVFLFTCEQMGIAIVGKRPG